MAFELPDFSQEQWHFLAVIAAFESPVPVDIVGALVPLPPVPLFDLLQRASQLHILEKQEGNVFTLNLPLPPTVAAKLKAINTAHRITDMLDQLSQFKMLNQLDLKSVARLLLQAQRTEETSQLQLTYAKKAICHQDVTTATDLLLCLTENQPFLSNHIQVAGQLSPMILNLSDLCFANGKALHRMLPLLQKTSAIAEAFGDRRSQALMDMHIGRILFLFGRFTEAFESLTSGKRAVEAIGDEDILTQASAFIGFYYYTKGQYKKALPYFEKAVAQTRFEEDDLINPFAPIFFAFSALYQFDRAYTILDIFHRKAEQKELAGVAVLLRVLLGYVLLRHRKEKEALTHLMMAQTKAGETGNDLALFWSKVSLTCHQFLIGNLPGARNLLAETLKEGARTGFCPAYTHFPWISEMLLELEWEQIEPVPDCSFDTVAESVMSSPTIPSKGWILRILGKRNELHNGPLSERRRYLEDSMKFLAHTEYRIEIAKAQIELARLELPAGNRNKAQAHAQEAWRNLPTYAENMFPDDLKHLIANVSKGPFLKSFMSPEVVLNRFSDLIEKIVPPSDSKALFSRLITATHWFFDAERSALFLFEGDTKRAKPQLLSAVNLTELEVASEAFQPRLKQIAETVRNGCCRPDKKSIDNVGLLSASTLQMLCFPLRIEENRQCVLYHENATIRDCFDYLDNQTLALLKTYIEASCRRIWQYCMSVQRHLSEETTDPENAISERIIGQSPVFLNVLKKARQIAHADFPILVQGETGVGKEIMARWIHANSPRRECPYVIIDSTTITEKLMESELFGHEKGAFTGADRQKPGRVELADRGTLFLDEVGELPLSIQAKLLRVLEKKTFTRVGGSRVHHCDFRLIAATNRDLSEEVRTGRFREDLFYRLNVLPLQIPPLRERKEDILLLARHFLEISCRQLKRPLPPITPSNVSELLGYRWPGNIRELKNIIERAVLLSNDNHLELQLAVTAPDSQRSPFEDMPTMTELQRRYIAYVLASTSGRIGGPGGAAEVLAMERTTLYSRMKKLNMPLTNQPDQET